MRIPIQQQLSRQDFPEAPSWISSLLYPLNLFMTIMTNALRNQLTLQDNFSLVVNDLTFVAQASADLNIFSFLWELNRQPIELTMHVTRSDGTYESIYPIPSWNLVGNSIQINGVQGLTPGVSYHIVTVVK